MSMETLPRYDSTSASESADCQRPARETFSSGHLREKQDWQAVNMHASNKDTKKASVVHMRRATTTMQWLPAVLMVVKQSIRPKPCSCCFLVDSSRVQPT